MINILMRRIAFICSIILFSSIVYAQGSLLKKGASGIGFQGGVATSSEASSLSGSVIITLGGIVDIGSSINSVSPEGRRAKNQTYIAVMAELYALREDYPRIPMSISFFGDFSEKEGNRFGSFGMTLYKKAVISKKSFIQPFFSVFKVWSTKFRTPGGVGFGFSFATTGSSKRIFSFTPAVALTEEINTYGFSFGITFGQTGYNRNGPPYFEN